jgi:hypothetical protein
MVDTEQMEELEPTPYQNEYRRTISDSDEEETEVLNLSDLSEEENTQKREGLVSKKQEHDWQKRYSDLKSHHDRQRNEWQQEKELLDAKAKLVGQTASLASMPKRTAEIEKRIAALTEKEEEAKYRTAEQELLVLHPDFLQLKDSSEFLEWLDSQPDTISNGIYKNRTDARWAARILDLYKMDSNVQPKSKSKKADAAEAVSFTQKTVSATSSGDKKIWTSAEISKLKPHEFERLETEIVKASREGRII